MKSYITFWKTTKTFQRSTPDLFDAIFNDAVPEATISDKPENPKKITVLTTPLHTANAQARINKVVPYLKMYNKGLAKFTEDDYHIFKIPKRNGTLRTISAPNEGFKEILKSIAHSIRDDLQVLEHANAYAYITNKSFVDAVKMHQQNNSRWFLKIDFKDFFPSCNPEFMFNTLRKVFPFSEITEEEANEHLKPFVKAISLNNGLPQGSPLSPYLTNILMVPFDYELEKALYAYSTELTQHFCITRYADDLLISARFEFDWRTVVSIIEDVCAKLNIPFHINTTKTRYASRSGRNWNLGLMLNKDNKITLGHKRIRNLKAMIYSYCSQKDTWEYKEREHLKGLISYWRMIEQSYADYILQRYSERYNNGNDILAELNRSDGMH